MSKEMAVIGLGIFVIVVRTMLGVPGSWQTALFVAAGVALVVIVFLLRGEAISRSALPRFERPWRSYPFVDNSALLLHPMNIKKESPHSIKRPLVLGGALCASVLLALGVFFGVPELLSVSYVNEATSTPIGSTSAPPLDTPH